MRKAAIGELPVVKVGVWHRAHPTDWNEMLPFVIDVCPPGIVVDGVGGARNRMKSLNFSIPLVTPIGKHSACLPPIPAVAIVLAALIAPTRAGSQGFETTLTACAGQPDGTACDDHSACTFQVKRHRTTFFCGRSEAENDRDSLQTVR